MKNTLLCSYLIKIIRSKYIYIALAGVIGICFSSYINNISNDIYSQIIIFTDFTIFRRLVVIFGSLPFAANFAEEYLSRYNYNCIIRSGLTKYITTNASVCYASSVITIFMGTLFYFSICSIFYPIYDNSGSLSDLDKIILESSCPILYIIVKNIVLSLNCGMWSVVGMLISSVFPNKYIALCSPLIANYVIERMTMDLPENINLMAISVCRLGWRNGVAEFIYCCFVPIGITILCIFLFIFIAKRRIQNEKC